MNSKVFFILMLLAVPGFLHAQHCDSIDNHMAGDCLMLPYQMIQLDGETLLIAADQENYSLDPLSVTPACFKFYKVSRHGATIIDSVTVENHDFTRHLMLARLPNTDDSAYGEYRNLLARIVLDEENVETRLLVDFFDDGLDFNEAMHLTVPLSDTVATYAGYIGSGDCLLDSRRNDLVVHYDIPSRKEVHFARIGLDGSIKHESVIPDTVIPTLNPVQVGGVSIERGWMMTGIVQNDSPSMGYDCFGTVSPSSDECFRVYELDSLFNVENSMEWPSSGNIYIASQYNGMVRLDDGSMLVPRRIYSQQIEGTGVVRCAEDGTAMEEVWFRPSPEPYGTTAVSSVINGLLKDGNGNVYYSFYFGSRDNTQRVAVVKMDEQLNVKWERYGMHKWATRFSRMPTRMELLDNGGVAVLGYNYGFKQFNYNVYPTGLFLMLLDDDGVGVTETDDTFRPYVFFPNPVDDRLFVHYSPDVSPRRAELYDMQGRLVGAQEGSLESVGMGHLPPGTYTLRILMNDGASFSDKVVKQ